MPAEYRVVSNSVEKEGSNPSVGSCRLDFSQSVANSDRIGPCSRQGLDGVGHGWTVQESPFQAEFAIEGPLKGA